MLFFGEGARGERALEERQVRGKGGGFGLDGGGGAGVGVGEKGDVQDEAGGFF